MVFAKGLLAGMQGDFLQGLHLLVPQLEYAIRRIFEQRGVLTTTFDQDDVQEDRTLGLLLQDARFQKAATAIFGKDLLFDLRGLLVEKWGGNLRNRVSHGLMRDDDFNDPQCQYLWWLTLRFVMWPYVLAMAQVDTAQASDDQQSA